MLVFKIKINEYICSLYCPSLIYYITYYITYYKNIDETMVQIIRQKCQPQLVRSLFICLKGLGFKFTSLLHLKEKLLKKYDNNNKYKNMQKNFLYIYFRSFQSDAWEHIHVR